MNVSALAPTTNWVHTRKSRIVSGSVMARTAAAVSAFDKASLAERYRVARATFATARACCARSRSTM